MVRTFALAYRFTLAAVAAVNSPRTTAADVTALALRPITRGGTIPLVSDDTVALMPDGKKHGVFDRSNEPHKTIVASHRVNGRWSKPRVTRFSGYWFDQGAAISPDGSYLLLNSNRPVGQVASR